MQSSDLVAFEARPSGCTRRAERFGAFQPKNYCQYHTIACKGGRQAAKHTAVVKNDGQERRIISPAHPVHTAGHGEQESSISDDRTYKSASGLWFLSIDELTLLLLHVKCKLDTDGSTTVPSEATGARVMEGSGLGEVEVVYDVDGLGDWLGAEDGVVWDELAELGDDVVCGEAAVFWFSGLLGDVGFPGLVVLCELFVESGVVSSGGLGFEVGVELREGNCGIGLEAELGVDVEDGHLLLERVDVEVEDLCVWGGVAGGWDPWNVAIDDENHIGLGDGRVDTVGNSNTSCCLSVCNSVEDKQLHTNVIVWEAHISSGGIENSDRNLGSQLDKFQHSLCLSSDVSSYNKWVFGVVKRLGNCFYC